MMHNGYEVKDSDIIDEPIDGSEAKFFINVGKRYLVKDSSYNKRRKQPSLSPYCEYVGSHFIKNCGMECQDTFLGKYMGRTVVICGDLFDGKKLKQFKNLHQSRADTDLNNKEYTYDDVIYVMKNILRLEHHLDEALDKFWELFVMDAILGNRDRHEGNWGFVMTDDGYKFSPIYDNGCSLFPDVDLTKWKDDSFLEERVFKIHGSQFKMWKEGITDRPMRTNYHEVIRDAKKIPKFQNAINKYSQIDIDEMIKKSLKDVPKDIGKWFASIIYCRYECLIKNRNFSEVCKEVHDDLHIAHWLSECGEEGLHLLQSNGEPINQQMHRRIH